MKSEAQNIAEIGGMMEQYEAWKMAIGRPELEYETLQQGTVIQTEAVVNIENLNVENAYDVDAMAWELGYLTAEELRRRGIIVG